MAGTHEKRLPSPRELQALSDAERAGLPFVHWRDGDGDQHILALSPEHPRVTVGRRREQVIALPWDPEVSRAHAYLELAGGEWTLVDDGMSRNGSFVNGQRVHGRRRLHDTDSLCFGNTHVIYREPDAGDDGSSTAQAPGSGGAAPGGAAQGPARSPGASSQRRSRGGLVPHDV